jgi:predicted permease
VKRRLRAQWRQLLAVFDRDRLDRDLAEELESHLALHVEDNLRAGMSPADARRQALVKLGGVAQIQEQHRWSRGLPAVEHVLRDLRYAARTLGALPAFTLSAVITLGLGIGANTAIFSVVNAALLQPFPVDRPDELVAINRAGAGVPAHSYPDYRDFRDRTTHLSGIAALRLSPMIVEIDGRATRIWGQLASGNYFDLLGVRAVLGRALAASDDRLPGAHPVLVLSHDFWRARFASDPRVVGRTVKVNGASFTILGVVPEGFRGTERLFSPDVWVPMMMQAHVESGNDWLERRQTHNIFLLGRRRPDVTVPQAEASLNAIAAELAREHPKTHEGLRIELSPPGLAGSLLRGPVIGFSSALLAITAMLLLLSCTNLTGLLLARSTDRRREIAIRLALGARRSDLVRRSLVESGLLSLAGATVAIVLAAWLATLVASWRLPVDLPLQARVSLDYRVLLFSLALAIVSTLLIGLVPAVHGTGIDVVPALKEETMRWRRGWHIRDVLVGVQVMLATLLLIGSLLMVRSLQEASKVDVGFEPHGAVSARVDLGLQRYDQERARIFQQGIVESVAALPGIESAAVANSIPLSYDVSTHAVFVEGRPEPRGADVPEAIYYQVSPGFFLTMHTRIVAGRDFGPGDTRDSPRVAIVNQAFADTLVQDEHPLGKRFRTGRSGDWVEIIGVVQDGKYQTLTEAATPVAFHSGEQWYNPTTSIVARTSLREGEATALVRQAVRTLDPGLSIFDDGPLEQVLALPLLPVRIAAVFLGAFGALAILLALVGTYGVVSYGVAQRTPEICIRLAVGATAFDIARLVLGRAAIVCATGAVAGAALAIAGGPLLSPLVLGVPPRDPGVIGLACLLLAFVTAAACWRPTRRALVSDPSALLRRG